MSLQHALVDHCVDAARVCELPRVLGRLAKRLAVDGHLRVRVLVEVAHQILDAAQNTVDQAGNNLHDGVVAALVGQRAQNGANSLLLHNQR